MDFTWIRAGANKAAAQEAYESGEDIKLDWWDRVRGATDEDAQNAYNRIQQKDLNTRLGAQFAQVGSTGADWGETYQQALGKINRLATERQAGQEAKQYAQSVQLLGEQQKPMMAQIAANTAAANKQLELSRLEYQAAREERRDARADQLNQRADELEYRRMQDRKEDLRYNESIERMDRKDRQQSIQTLVAGLANLGAAFAL